MSSDLLLRLGLGVLAACSLLVLFGAIRHRRHVAHLKLLAKKHSLGLTTGKCPSDLIGKASRYRSKKKTAALRDVLVGFDDHAGFFLATRRIGRARHQLLYFELDRTAHLEGFHVVPEKTRRSKDIQLCLEWRAPRKQWSDERALSMGARVLYHMSVLGEKDSAIPLGAEIRGREVWIHSDRPLRGRKLDRFVGDAMKLRHLLLKSLQRANGVSRASGHLSSRVSQQVQTISSL